VQPADTQDDIDAADDKDAGDEEADDEEPAVIGKYSATRRHFGIARLVAKRHSAVQCHVEDISNPFSSVALHAALSDDEVEVEEYYTPSEGELDLYEALNMPAQAPEPAEDEPVATHPLLLGNEDVASFSLACGKFPYPKPVRTEDEVRLILELAQSDSRAGNKSLNYAEICKVQATCGFPIRKLKNHSMRPMIRLREKHSHSASTASSWSRSRSAIRRMTW
jgi:hypothetical protein